MKMISLFRFKYKYHPDEFPKRRAEQRQIIQKRLEIFMDLYNKDYLKDVTVDIDNQRALTRFLDAGRRFLSFHPRFRSLSFIAVIKMEGGTDHDLRVLDADNESESVAGSETSKDPDAEAGEVPDAPRSLHRTASVFFRHLAMQTTKEELENVSDFIGYENNQRSAFRFVNNTTDFVVFVSLIQHRKENLLVVVGRPLIILFKFEIFAMNSIQPR